MEAIDREAEVLLPRSQWSRRGFAMTSVITGFACPHDRRSVGLQARLVK
jgi:hypothetical protein